MRRTRDPYAVVGQAMRESIRRAARAKELGERDRRVHAAVLDRTASFSKLADETSLTEIAMLAYGIDRAAVTGWHRKRVAESLRKLSALDIVAYASDRGPNAGCRVEIATEPYGRVLLDEEESNPAAGSDSDERHPAVARVAPRRRAEKNPTTAATPRSTEEHSEREPLSLDDFEIDEQLRERAATAHPGVDVDRERAAFINHAKANGRTFADVGAAFRLWMRNARPTTSPPATSTNGASAPSGTRAPAWCRECAEDDLQVRPEDCDRHRDPDAAYYAEMRDAIRADDAESAA